MKITLTPPHPTPFPLAHTHRIVTSSGLPLIQLPEQLWPLPAPHDGKKSFIPVSTRGGTSVDMTAAFHPLSARRDQAEPARKRGTRLAGESTQSILSSRCVFPR